MRLLRAVWDELFGLFVDDGRFAVFILAWLALCGLLLPRLGLPAAVPPLALAAGLCAILIESVWRRAR